MMEESTQTNIYERPKKRADQRELLYSLKKLKKEQGKEQYYIIL